MTTRAEAEAELIARLGTWMTAAGLDGTTIDGTNADLSSPLGYALRVVESNTVPDVASADLDKLYDLAELRALENVLQNYKKIDGKAGPVEGKADQLGQRMERRLVQLRGYVAATYGVGVTGAVVWTSVTATYGETTTDEFERPPNYWP